jgi:hypothetical protein
MRLQHTIEPEFGIFLMSFVKALPCSHAFFKGKMINLLKNTENKQYKQVIYLLQRESYDELYFCGCPPWTIKNGHIPIFFNQEQY